MFRFRENDEDVGMCELDNRVKEQAPTSEEEKEVDKVQEFFLKLAGEDGEVDWQELKEILDFAMRNELPVGKGNVMGVEANVKTATEYPTSNHESDNIFTTLLGLICARFFKEIVPEQATTQNVAPTSTTSYIPEVKTQGFSKDICRSMVAMLDNDKSGKLGFEEFKKLWVDIRNWKLVFKMYDKDNSGALSGFELRNAINSAGYKLNNHILNILMHRYGGKNAEIYFDDFILCSVKLKTVIETFKKKDPNGTNSATFSLEDWMEGTLYS